MADINRFMVPAEIPQPSFFQLPYEQMKQGLLVAQQQQDQARNSLNALGDIQFNYLTNPQDVKLADEMYGYVDKGINDVVGKQGNGDLRGLKNDINTHAKNVGRLFRPDQAIGKLQSNYAAFNDWYKKQLDNKDLDPTYVHGAAEKFINDYDQAGGARTGSVSTENLLKFFDPSKFVNDNKDMIKSTLIENNKDVVGNNGYIYSYEDLIKRIPPERVKATMAQILLSNPEYNSSLAQRVRLGNLPKESLSLFDSEGNLNPLNPAAPAISGAMSGLGVIEEERHGFGIKSDETWLAFWRRKNEKEDAEKEQALITTKDFTQGYTQEAINNLQSNFDGSPQAVEALQNATAGYAEIVTSNFLDKNGNFKKEVAPYFEGIKDVNGNTIDSKDVLQAYTMAMHNPSGNLGNGIWVDEKVIRQVLESKKDDKGQPKYKINWDLKDGLFNKVSSLANGLAGNETDIPKLNALGYDISSTFGEEQSKDPVKKKQTQDFMEMRSKMFDQLKEYEVKQKQTGVTSSQDNYYALDPNTKNPIGKQLQDFGSVSKIASGFTFVDKTTGQTGSLDQFIKDNSVGGKDVVTAFSPDNNAQNKGGLGWTMTFNELDKKGKIIGTKEVTVKPKTAAMLNQMEALASEALYRTNKYTQQQPSINTAGNVARSNVVGAVNNSALDENINAFTKNDEYASTIMSIPVGKIGNIDGKNFKRLTNNTIYFINGPSIGTTLQFSNESELKQKLNELP